MGLAVSCSDDEPGGAVTSNGMHLRMGDPAVDGGGLGLEVDSIRYFASSQQNTFITFRETDRGSIDEVARYRI